MTAKQWLDIILMSKDCPKEIKSLIEEYGNMRVTEYINKQLDSSQCNCEPPITRDSDDSSICYRCGENI